MSTNHGFPPIAAPDARILILGSMPGKRSLEKYQYYAHPRNNFWPIILELFNSDKKLSYEQRKKFLHKNKIALWDVLKSCYREGSLDSDIDPLTIEANDFKSFFMKHPKIKNVFFNGAKAEQIFKKEISKNLIDIENLTFHKLPSTSPAHAAMSREKKLSEWKIIKELI